MIDFLDVRTLIAASPLLAAISLAPTTWTIPLRAIFPMKT